MCVEMSPGGVTGRLPHANDVDIPTINYVRVLYKEVIGPEINVGYFIRISCNDDCIYWKTAKF